MKCSTTGCSNNRAPNRTICYTCRNRKYREKNPKRYSYHNLKGNARRRGKFFDITFEEFVQFCNKTQYIQKKGVTKVSFHIDRIDESKGYTFDNIQVLTNVENRRKYIKWVSRNPDGSSNFRTVDTLELQSEDIDWESISSEDFDF